MKKELEKKFADKFYLEPNIDPEEIRAFIDENFVEKATATIPSEDVMAGGVLKVKFYGDVEWREVDLYSKEKVLELIGEDNREIEETDILKSTNKQQMEFKQREFIYDKGYNQAKQEIRAKLEE